MRAREFLSESYRSVINEELRVDVPNEEWLQDAIDYAKSKSPDRNGLPYMGKTTASVRNVDVPLSILRRIPGMRQEQSKVRHHDLAAIRKIMHTTGKLPLHGHTGQEYKPFINVAYDGSAWVNEGNHRIMAAAELGWESLPVEISYFDGGERIKSGPMYPGKIGLAEAMDQGTRWTGDEPYRDLVELDLEEGWKDLAVGAAMGLGALGAGNSDAKPIEPIKKPGITQQAQQPVKAAAATLDNKAEIALFNAGKAAGMRGSELAQFLAQVKHESWNFSRLKEKPQPKVKDYFAKKYDPKFAPKTAKILGNNRHGDGAKYYGRGYIQLTGKDNYRKAGDALKLDLVNHPELAADPAHAANIAVWFWNNRVKPGISNFDDTTAVTKKINNAGRGLEDRLANFVDYKKRIKPA